MKTHRTLRIRFTVPITAAKPMAFYRWLPTGLESGLKSRHGCYAVTLWLDESCSTWTRDLGDIARCPSVPVHRLYVDVETAEVDDDLLGYMRTRDFTRQPTSDEAARADAYENHGKEVFIALVHCVNRLMDYVRTKKGQFWLIPYSEDLGRIASTAVAFEAKAQIAEGRWFRWQPSQTIHLSGEFPSGRRSITPDDWKFAQAYLESDERPELTRQLVAGAELLAEAGQDRAALTEAVSALEVAVHRFARSEKWSQSLRPELRDRVATQSLERLVSRIGLTATVDYILPLIFSEQDLSAALLAQCQQAILQRQNVVHDGMRQVDPKILKGFLAAIRQLCEILLRAGGI